jgi:hypothetical protein
MHQQLDTRNKQLRITKNLSNEMGSAQTSPSG